MSSFRFAHVIIAQKDSAPKLNNKKSWFGGWLGGGKKEGDGHGTPNAPIKAKLGEESSFYYDKEKKKWVDKKNPDTANTSAPAPPPPRGPPSRAASATGPPPMPPSSTPPVPPLPMLTETPPISVTKPPTSGAPSSNRPSYHPSRSPSPAPNSNTAEEPAAVHSLFSDSSGPPSGPPSAPPSRPATGMSGANSIDDLIGAPQARKGGTVRKGKKGRGYVDVMAK